MTVTLAKLARVADQKDFDIDGFLPQLKKEAFDKYGNSYRFTKEQANSLSFFIQTNCPERKDEVYHTSKCQVTLHGYSERFCNCR